MNELFLKHVDNIVRIKYYKIDSKLFIVKLVLWNKHTVCFIVKDEEVKQLWKANNDYIILIEILFKFIKFVKSFVKNVEMEVVLVGSS